MSIASTSKDPSEIAAEIVQSVRTAVSQLNNGLLAATGQGNMNAIVGLHNYLKGLSKTWASYGLIDQSGLTPMGVAVENIFKQRETALGGDGASYSLLAEFTAINAAGANLTDVIEATIGTKPAHYIFGATTEEYVINIASYPTIETAIRGVLASLEG